MLAVLRALFWLLLEEACADLAEAKSWLRLDRALLMKVVASIDEAIFKFGTADPLLL
tara:strand:- start:96 stop:266 length:171 start_codon:yes stop_codon:yes gene_type:complete